MEELRPITIIRRNIVISVIIGFAYQIYSVCGATIFTEIVEGGLGELGGLGDLGGLGGLAGGNGTGNAIKELLKSFNVKEHGKFLLIPVVCIKVGIGAFYLYKFYMKKIGNKNKNKTEGNQMELSTRQATDNNNLNTINNNQNSADVVESRNIG